MFKFIEIDPNLLLDSLSCELGQQNNQISIQGGGGGRQASGTPDDHVINCRPHGFYDMIIFCPNSHNKLSKPKFR